MMTIPTKAGPDTVCACGHWYEEHDPDGGCAGCDASGQEPNIIAHDFEFWPEYNTPEAIADRGGDPNKWPEWVKEAITAMTIVPVPGSPEARVLAALTGEPPSTPAALTIHEISTATGYPVAVVFRILVRLRAGGHRVIAVPDGTLTRFTVLEVAYSPTGEADAADSTIDNGDTLSATE